MNENDSWVYETIAAALHALDSETTAAEQRRAAMLANLQATAPRSIFEPASAAPDNHEPPAQRPSAGLTARSSGRNWMERREHAAWSQRIRRTEP